MRARTDHRKAQHGEAVILFRVGESTFAIAASVVDEIRNVQGLKSLPLADAATGGMVRHTLTRNGRKYFVVDATARFHMAQVRPTRVLVLRNTAVALLVGDIDRMTEIGAMHVLPKAFRGAERDWYRGLAVLETGRAAQVVPVVNPGALLDRAESQMLSDLAIGADAS